MHQFDLIEKADFCNPGLLGKHEKFMPCCPCEHSIDDYSTFRRAYEVPIIKSRAPDCTVGELELGEARSAQVHNTVKCGFHSSFDFQLTAIAKSFVLRREATILKNYLPPKRTSHSGSLTSTPLLPDPQMSILYL